VALDRFEDVPGLEHRSSDSPYVEGLYRVAPSGGHGAFLRNLPVGGLVDGRVSSPRTTPRSFVLQGSEWEIPTYENAETFVGRLVGAGLLVRDPLVTDVGAGERPVLVTPRSVQRRVAVATGLTQGVIRQIEWARQATMLLRQGVAATALVRRVGDARRA